MVQVLASFGASMLRVALLAAAGWIVASPVAAQDPMEEQRLVWRCDYNARDRGLTGASAERFREACYNDGMSRMRPRASAKAAPKRAGNWRVVRLSQVQFDLVATSRVRGFSLSLTCMTSASSPKGINGFLSIPRGWRPLENDVFEIDGVVAKDLRLDGSEGGFSVSDSIDNNASVVSLRAIEALSAGSRLVVAGMQGRRRRDVAFDISGGADAFAAFRTACGKTWPDAAPAQAATASPQAADAVQPAPRADAAPKVAAADFHPAADVLKGVELVRAGQEAEGYKALLAAAQGGDAVAQANVGYMLWLGIGAPRDQAEALRWLEKSAAAGDAFAGLALGRIYMEATDVDLDLTGSSARLRPLLDGIAGPEAAYLLIETPNAGRADSRDPNAFEAERRRLCNAYLPSGHRIMMVTCPLYLFGSDERAMLRGIEGALAKKPWASGTIVEKAYIPAFFSDDDRKLRNNLLRNHEYMKFNRKLDVRALLDQRGFGPKSRP